MLVTITRGDLLVVRATPKDADGNPTTPLSVALYINYTHADGTVSTDGPIAMTNSSGTWSATFDTKVAKPGPAYVSVRATGPASARDVNFTITANSANPAPT